MKITRTVLTAVALTVLMTVMFASSVAADPMFVDPADDMHTANGFAVATPYLDITSYQLSVSTSTGTPIYNATFNMNGKIPASATGFVAWELLVDADYNAMTAPCGHYWLLDHQIGVDYVIRFYIRGNSFGAEAYTCDSNSGSQISMTPPTVKVQGNQVTLLFCESDIGMATVFAYVFATVQYSKYTYHVTSCDFVKADIAPNYGYESFGGYVVPAIRFSA